MATSLESTLGAEFIGNIVVNILFGLTSLQTFVYFRDYPKDPLSLKLPIALLWCLSTAHFCFVCSAMYQALIVNYGNVDESLGYSVDITLQYLMDSCIEIIVRSIYCIRLWTLIGWNTYAVVLISMLSLVNCGAAFAACILLFLALKSQAILAGSLITKMLYLNGASIITLEVMITGCFCVFLTKHMKRGLRLRKVVPTLIAYTVSSTMLTLATHVPALIFSIVQNNNYISTALQVILPGLYVNSLLTWLNLRKRMREEVQNYFDDHGGPRTDRDGNQRISSLRFQPSSRSSGYPISTTQRDEEMIEIGEPTTDSDQTVGLDKKARELDHLSTKLTV